MQGPRVFVQPLISLILAAVILAPFAEKTYWISPNMLNLLEECKKAGHKEPPLSHARRLAVTSRETTETQSVSTEPVEPNPDTHHSPVPCSPIKSPIKSLHVQQPPVDEPEWSVLPDPLVASILSFAMHKEDATDEFAEGGPLHQIVLDCCKEFVSRATDRPPTVKDLQKQYKKLISNYLPYIEFFSEDDHNGNRDPNTLLETNFTVSYDLNELRAKMAKHLLYLAENGYSWRTTRQREHFEVLESVLNGKVPNGELKISIVEGFVEANTKGIYLRLDQIKLDKFMRGRKIPTTFLAAALKVVLPYVRHKYPEQTGIKIRLGAYQLDKESFAPHAYYVGKLGFQVIDWDGNRLPEFTYLFQELFTNSLYDRVSRPVGYSLARSVEYKCDDRTLTQTLSLWKSEYQNKQCQLWPRFEMELTACFDSRTGWSKSWINSALKRGEQQGPRRRQKM